MGRVLTPLGRGTWIRLIIRLDVDLALGQHLGKLPLQLLKLGVVRDNVNRSTESVRDERGWRGEDNPGLGARGWGTAGRTHRGTRRAEGDRRLGHGHSGPQCGGCSTELCAGSGRGVQGLTTTRHGLCVSVFWANARVGRVCLLRMGQRPQGRKLWAQMT